MLWASPSFVWRMKIANKRHIFVSKIYIINTKQNLFCTHLQTYTHTHKHTQKNKNYVMGQSKFCLAYENTNDKAHICATFMHITQTFCTYIHAYIHKYTQKNKHYVMGQSKFCLAYENSIDPDYVTEKLFDCLRQVRSCMYMYVYVCICICICIWICLWLCMYVCIHDPDT
jgi:hypothetical protein